MYFKWGNFQHPANEINLAVAHSSNYSARGFRESVKTVYSLNGKILCPSNISAASDRSKALTALIQSMSDAYSDDAQDCGLYLDDGTATFHTVRSGDTYGGTRVKAMNFAQGAGAEYVNFITYSIVLEWEILDLSEPVLEFFETVSVRGTGGPKIVYVDCLESQPQAQTAQQYTTVHATQSGHAKGSSNYIPGIWPSPIWPDWEKLPERKQNMGSPKLWRGDLTEWPSEWEYSFESNRPLDFARPHIL